MKKMYIAVLDTVPDYMVPTLVAHSVLGAHLWFSQKFDDEIESDYHEWLTESFKKVVLRVNNKEFYKIHTTLECWAGHENTTLGGLPSCLVVLPVDSEKVPNVLKFAKMWKPRGLE